MARHGDNGALPDGGAPFIALCSEEMEAFDNLPKSLRDYLNSTVFPFSAKQCAGLMGSMTEGEMIEAMERFSNDSL